MSSIILAGLGYAVPERVFTNDDFAAKGIETSDEWIRTRTGIRERHLASELENTTTLGAQAARKALETSKLESKDIELIVVATLTPERPMPSSACSIGKALGLEGIPSFDVSAACSGFIYALTVAEALMKSRGYKTALVIGAEKLSSITDWTDRTTCVLFGDGAGAAVLKAVPEEKVGLIDTLLGADGKLGDLLTLPKGGTISMNGKEIFKHAVTVMGNSCVKLLERNNLTKDDLACVIPHQANNRIIEAIADRLKLPMERFYVNVDRYGNTSAASIPIALAEAAGAGRLKKGDWLLLVAFGGGLTWAGALIKWQ